MRHLRIFSLSLVLLLLLASAAAATAFTFRSGVTWDTTPAQMLAAEGRQAGDDTYNRHTYNGYTFYYLWNRGEKTEDVYYVFVGEAPVMAYTLVQGGDFAAAQEQMAARYGAPADVSKETVSRLQNALIPSSTLPTDFSALAAWRLADGTLAALFTINGETYRAYFHQQRIPGGM